MRLWTRSSLARWLYLPGLCVFAGCVTQEGTKLSLVPGNPFGTPPPAVGSGQLKTPTTDNETAVKVDYVGRKLIAANPHIGLRPYFICVGLATPEIFHLEQKAVYVTEGLVKKCKTEEELAAVLAHELGRIVAEREILASSDPRSTEQPLSDTIAAEAKQPKSELKFFELVKQELTMSPRPQNLPRPNPRVLAGGYLEKAGYPRTILAEVQPVLDEADNNCALERQLKGLPPRNGWGPAG